MRLKKRILGMGLAMSLMFSGLYVAPEKVRAEVENENTQKVESISRGTVIAAKSSGKIVKMPEKAVDGSRIIVTSSFADSDGEYIYYAAAWLSPNKIMPFLKRNIKTGKETVIGSSYIAVKLYKDYLLCEPIPLGIADYDFHVDRIPVNGKGKKIFDKIVHPVIVGNTLYCWYYDKITNFGLLGGGIYKMGVNLKNKKIIKKETDVDQYLTYEKLGTSGSNVYYQASKDKSKWINIKTGKIDDNITLSYLYDPVSNTKFTFNKNGVKAGKYENSKWKYKTIFKGGNLEVDDMCVCGGKILVKTLSYGENWQTNAQLYITDLDGKNKKLLIKGKLAEE